MGLGTFGINFIAEDGDNFSFNEGEKNVDFRYYNSDEATMVFFDADTSKVGIGEAISETPAKTLTVKGDISASGDLFAGDINGSYMHYDHSAKQLIIDSVYETSNEDYFTIKKGTSNVIFNVDEDGDVSCDGGLIAGGSVKGNGYFYGTDNDSSLQISSTGHRIRVNDGTQVVAWFDDDQISLAPGSQDVDLKIGASGLGGFFDYGTTNFGVGTITPTKKLTVAGDISASGDFVLGSLGVSSGYISASNGNIEMSGSGLGLTVGSWTDGYHGSDTVIPLLPTDFQNASATGRVFYSQLDGGHVYPQHPNSDAIVQKTIPRGFTATHVDIYGANNEEFYVYKGEIDNDTTPQVEDGSSVMNSQCTLTEPVSGSDGTQYLTIHVNTDHSSDTIFGGKITITRTT